VDLKGGLIPHEKSRPEGEGGGKKVVKQPGINIGLEFFF